MCSGLPPLVPPATGAGQVIWMVKRRDAAGLTPLDRGELDYVLLAAVGWQRACLPGENPTQSSTGNPRKYTTEYAGVPGILTLKAVAFNRPAAAAATPWYPHARTSDAVRAATRTQQGQQLHRHYRSLSLVRTPSLLCHGPSSPCHSPIGRPAS